MKRRRQSITFRITLLFAVVATLVLLVLGLLIEKSVDRHFVELDMELLSGKTDLTAHLLEQISVSTDMNLIPRKLEDALVGHHGLAVVVVDAAGTRLFANSDTPFPEAMLKPAGVSIEPQTWLQDNQYWRGISTLLQTGSSDLPPVLVAVAVDATHHEHFLESFRHTLWLSVGIAVLMVAVLGWVVVRRELSPLQTMRQRAASVTANHLDYRLDSENIPVELAQLAETLNDMLARLEESFQRLKDFSSDLAHELRTPISNLMTETQVALTRARSPDEYRDVLASNAEEYERLARMIGDMLFLAQAENGLIIPRREVVDLAKQVQELFDFFEALAEEKGLHLVLEGNGSVSGDKLMLRRALANLISNAVRHTPSGGHVQVFIETIDDITILRINNTGEPIPPDHLSRIFDRFYRVDPSRHNTGEGAGLGLAITRSIIHAHDGEISVRSGPDDVCFEIRLK